MMDVGKLPAARYSLRTKKNMGKQACVMCVSYVKSILQSFFGDPLTISHFIHDS